MQDTCVYQAPVEVGELKKKKKKNAILHFRNVLFFIITTVFVALKKIHLHTRKHLLQVIRLIINFKGGMK